MSLIKIEDYKANKLVDRTNEIANSTREGGLVIAEACFKLAYLAEKRDSELKANKRNQDKLN